MPSFDWIPLVQTGTAQECHDYEPLVGFGRELVFCHPDSKTVVLGSTQRPDILDLTEIERRGISTARRRSGGGLVMVEPGGQLWANLYIGPDDSLWVNDVVRAFDFLSVVTAKFLDSIGVSDYQVHERQGQSTSRAPRICFSGLGVSEAEVRGRKLTGVSQRRRREYVCFQFQCLFKDNQSELLELLNFGPLPNERVEVIGLRDLGVDHELTFLEKALFSALSDCT